jgi:GMP synthase (glutamine-hydrolysing)
MPASVLVVQNTPAGGLGRWKGWLTEAGVRPVVRAAHSGDALPEVLGPHRGLVVLGGGYLPDDDVRAPWLPRARALVRQALDTGAPMFGICLGGQMLAHVAGGTVAGAYGRPEFGSTPLLLRAEARDDPLFRGLPPRPRAVENHIDAITRLPPGARWLVRSEDCPYQAFRVGDRAWGVQFHPETTAQRIAGWDAARLSRYGVDRDRVREAALRHDVPSSAAWRHLAHRFAEQVHAV